jgi:hypothetical protein
MRSNEVSGSLLESLNIAHLLLELHVQNWKISAQNLVLLKLSNFWVFLSLLENLLLYAALHFRLFLGIENTYLGLGM